MPLQTPLWNCLYFRKVGTMLLKAQEVGDLNSKRIPNREFQHEESHQHFGWGCRETVLKNYGVVLVNNEELVRNITGNVS